VNRTNLLHRSITDLVGENYVYASVLYHMGIQFFDYSTETLEQVCSARGLSTQKVIDNLESVNNADQRTEVQLASYPVDLVVAYLKHAHFLFIKRDLPFMARLIEQTPASFGSDGEIIADMKTVFPLFVEDFVKHIYEEEDQLFTFVEELNLAQKRKGNLTRLFLKMEKISINDFAMEHEVHDDEMKGMRKITHNYDESRISDLRIKVLYNELRNFEEKLKIHASIENEVLFPKAMLLEKRVRQMYGELARNN
jgi:regulator of cell morphogenesis and NO signaling